MSFYKVKAMKAEKWGKSRKGSPYITLNSYQFDGLI